MSFKFFLRVKFVFLFVFSLIDDAAKLPERESNTATAAVKMKIRKSDKLNLPFLSTIVLKKERIMGEN